MRLGNRPFGVSTALSIDVDVWSFSGSFSLFDERRIFWYATPIVQCANGSENVPNLMVAPNFWWPSI